MEHAKQFEGAAETKPPLRRANKEADEEGYNFIRSRPPGWSFKPEDEELIVSYLIKKVFKRDLPANIINQANIYKYNPDVLIEKYKDNEEEAEWYFFTPRERKYPNGSRPNRAAGDGYWKATGADMAIYYKGKKVGFKKALVFYMGKPPKGAKTNWMMHEYRVIDGLLPPPPSRAPNDMRLDDWILCKIYEKANKLSCKGPSGQKDELTPEKDRLMGNPYPSEVNAGFEVPNNSMGDQISDVSFDHSLENYVFDFPREPSHIHTNFSCMTNKGFVEQKKIKTTGFEDENVSSNLPPFPPTIFNENEYELKHGANDGANECIDYVSWYKENNDEFFRLPFFESLDFPHSEDSLLDIPPMLQDQYDDPLN